MRRYEQRDLRIGHYAVAYSTYANADLVQIVTAGDEFGILLLDTEGHSAYAGQRMQRLLQRVIRRGWGFSGNAREELERLFRRITGSHPNQTFERHPWANCSCAYLQFPNRGYGNIHVCGAGLPPIMHLGDGTQTHIDVPGSILLTMFGADPCSPEYDNQLRPGDTVVAQTDGLTENWYRSHTEPPQFYTAVNGDHDPRTVIDTIIDAFPECLPSADEHDDISIVAVQKIN